MKRVSISFVLSTALCFTACDKGEKAADAPAQQSVEGAPVEFEGGALPLRDDCVGPCIKACQPFADDFERCKAAYAAGCFGDAPQAGFDCAPFLEAPDDAPATDEEVQEDAPSPEAPAPAEMQRNEAAPAEQAPPPEMKKTKGRGASEDGKRNDPGLKMLD